MVTVKWLSETLGKAENTWAERGQTGLTLRWPTAGRKPREGFGAALSKVLKVT